MKIGKELKELRLSSGKSLLQVEKETGISNQNISRWERNEVLPNIDFCVKLARCYGVTLEELIGLNENQE
jgi:transcriptional regulator with XRE-family HTH domain